MYVKGATVHNVEHKYWLYSTGLGKTTIPLLNGLLVAGEFVIIVEYNKWMRPWANAM